MQFTKVGELDIVTRVTGPTHHFLGMVLAPGSTPETPILERVSIDRPQAELEPFDPAREICREVLTAVQDANDRLGTRFGVVRIRYCVDDPPVAGIYGRLAHALVEHAFSEQEQEATLQPSFAETDGRREQLSTERV
jgi:hypothetical protein